MLFAGDAFLPLPYMVDGDPDVMSNTIKAIGKMGLENIIQGHGDIILRGEIDDAVRDNLAYIANVRKAVRAAARRKIHSKPWQPSILNPAARAGFYWAALPTICTSVMCATCTKISLLKRLW